MQGDLCRLRASWGSLLLILLCCGDEVERLCQQHPDATPSELLLLFRDAILSTRAPVAYAERQAWSLHRRAPARRSATEARSLDEDTATAAPDLRLDIERIWARLTDGEREVLSLALNGFEGVALAIELGTTEDAAEQRLTRARRRARELFSEL